MQHSTYSSSFVCWKNSLIIVRIPNWYGDAIYMFVEEKQNITEARLNSFFSNLWDDQIFWSVLTQRNQNKISVQSLIFTSYVQVCTAILWLNSHLGIEINQNKNSNFYIIFFMKTIFSLIQSSVGLRKKYYQYRF